MGSVNVLLLITVAGVAGLAILGVHWLILAARGRRVGGGPRCRGCGYDVRTQGGLPEQCPECGADLGPRWAVVFADRRRQPRDLVLGVAAIGLVAALLVGGVVLRARPGPGNAGPMAAAAATNATAVERLFARARQGAVDPEWGRRVGASWRQGEISSEELERAFAELVELERTGGVENGLRDLAPIVRRRVLEPVLEALTVDASTPPSLIREAEWAAVGVPRLSMNVVTHGDPNIEVMVGSMRSEAGYRITDARVRGEGVDRPLPTALRLGAPALWSPGDLRLPRGLEPGHYELLVTFEQSRRGGGGGPLGRTGAPRAPSVMPGSVGTGGPATARRTIVASHAFRVMPRSTPPVPLASSEAAAATLRTLLEACVVRIERFDDRPVSIDILAPNPAAFRAADTSHLHDVVVIIDGETSVVETEFVYGNTTISRGGTRRDTPAFNGMLPDTATIELRPAPERWDVMVQYGEPVSSIFGDVVRAEVPLVVVEHRGDASGS